MRKPALSALAALAIVSTACPSKDSKKDTAPAGKAGGPAAADIPAPPDVAAPPADAQKTASGLASKVLTPGTSAAHPEEQDTVEVNYTGWTTDGKMFDASARHGGPAKFGLKGVIPGWTEGLQLMVVGEKRRFWIPDTLAYKGRSGPQGTLVFDVELLGITPGPKPIPAPADVADPGSDAKKTATGVAYKVLKKGDGKGHPGPTDRVKVNYTGWTTNGKMFDSSLTRGQPAEFPLDHVIPGWTEAVQLMEIGDKMRFWIPEELAYKGRPGAPQGTLVFEIDLLEFTAGPKPPPVPEDVKAPPKTAKKTKSGLAYRQLAKGKGAVHPKPTDRVKVHYTGWTASDGKQFDSSVTRGQPAMFPLNGVIPGWTEGLGLMVEGEKMRLWIPEEMAYKGQPGRPQGMLVFDVELLEIMAPPPPAPPPGASSAPPTGATGGAQGYVVPNPKPNK
jgi:peptidylprolyl isomerase